MHIAEMHGTMPSITRRALRIWRNRRGALMPEYVFVTAAALTIAALIGAMGVSLSDGNERALELIDSNLP